MTGPAAPGGPLAVALTVEQLWQPTPGGSGTYVRELARALAARADVDVRGLAARGHGSDGPGSDGVGLPPGLPVTAAPLPRAALYPAWSHLRAPATARSLTGLGRRHRVDVVHATTWAVPPRVAPLVVTVHDLAFLRDPAHFTARGNRFFRRALHLVREEAAAVVVPSAATAADCVAHGIDRARLHVVPHGVRTPAVTAGEVAGFRDRHGLHRPYVLWCGTLEPRKNLPVLLEAYRASGLDLDLVLVGPDGWGGAAEAVGRTLGTLPAGRVHRLGRLPEADLHRAYAGAHVFCFPSTWEGFGLPVLEALAHGVPVVTSAGTSMAELAPAHVAELVDPASPDSVAAGLVRAAGDRHAALAAAAQPHAAAYTWERSAAVHAEVFRTAARR